MGGCGSSRYGREWEQGSRMTETGRYGDNIAGNMTKIGEHEEEIKSFKMAQTRVFYLY